MSSEEKNSDRRHAMSPTGILEGFGEVVVWRTQESEDKDST